MRDNRLDILLKAHSISKIAIEFVIEDDESDLRLK